MSMDQQQPLRALSSRIPVLVVDDHDTGRYAKTRILRQAGFEVAEAINGTDALRMIEQWKPRLVLLDVQLPDIDGWQVCRRVKSDPETSSVLVLQISATFVTEADTVRALEGGADGCLTEPVEGPVLVATVRALLRAREAEDQMRRALALEQEARAAAESANRSKDEFLAVLSHELRSPLGAIVTWVSLIRGGHLDPSRQHRGLEAIERNARLQIKLIEDLLDISRIVSGKMSLELGPVEATTLVESALESVRPLAESKQIELTTDFDPELGAFAADGMRLQQVLWNLLSNAVKFTPPRGRVKVSTRRLDGHAQFQVADTGKGISPEFLPYVFDRFRQADSSTTREEGGLGLGLAIARHLVELHGGTIVAESAGQAQGTTFTIRVPLTPPRARIVSPALKSEGGPAPLASNHLDGLRVMVVDDEADVREAIAAVLESSGAAVTVASNVPDAIAAFDRAFPDVLVSDIGMPIQDGYALIRHVRVERPPDQSVLPALALTAYGTAEQRTRILESGFHGYLIKPVGATELVAAVARLAGGLART